MCSEPPGFRAVATYRTYANPSNRQPRTTLGRSRRRHRLRPHQQALDDAARLYVKLRGDTTAVPTGRIEQLLRAADDADGGLGPEEIAEILDTDELAVAANEPPTEISVGDG